MNRQLNKIRTATYTFVLLYEYIHMWEVRKFKVIKYIQVSVYFWVTQTLFTKVHFHGPETGLTYCALYVSLLYNTNTE
jgi:hypothetical protein